MNYPGLKNLTRQPFHLPRTCQHKCLLKRFRWPCLCVDLEGLEKFVLSANFRLSRTGALWKQIWCCHLITNPIRRILYCFARVVSCLQGDSGGKVSILGGDSVGYCEGNSSYAHLIFGWPCIIVKLFYYCQLDTQISCSLTQITLN